MEGAKPSRGSQGAAVLWGLFLLLVCLVWGFGVWLVFGYTIRPYQEDAGLCYADYPVQALLQAGIGGLGLAAFLAAVVRAFEGGTGEGEFKAMRAWSYAGFALLGVWVAAVSSFWPPGSAPCP
jgi:hypothetical protein